ncbi:MAG: hypothetical protein ACP5HQ_03190 [Thermoprotei archaeon]
MGIPDSVVGNLVVESTISRRSLRHIYGRAVIIAYMCMRGEESRATLIVPTTPGEDVGDLVIPNAGALDYLSSLLEEVEEERNPFCKSCLYGTICPYS